MQKENKILDAVFFKENGKKGYFHQRDKPLFAFIEIF